MLDRPVIAIIGCNKIVEGEPAHIVKARYVDAVVKHAGAAPLLVPSLGNMEIAAAIVPRVDAILLTGSHTNIEPRNYGSAEPGREPKDISRDRTSLAVIKAARHFSVPVIGICRGLQEINVALGGTLADERDLGAQGPSHHAPDGSEMDVMFAYSHAATAAPASLMARIAGTGDIEVNSVHFQRIATLGEGLRVEATSGDGVIEAIASREADPLILAVQWHPEWRPEERAHDVAFWHWVGEMARRYAARRASGVTETGPAEMDSMTRIAGI